mmetsp:Transcript_6352/g.12915  ORF Transcript_6352/g.12915 Transcript_6352/m.12915 type:complete len:92 (+) Transcript_6352:536-811(+)
MREGRATSGLREELEKTHQKASWDGVSLWEREAKQQHRREVGASSPSFWAAFSHVVLLGYAAARDVLRSICSRLCLIRSRELGTEVPHRAA